jgi:hypothetical protein
MWAITWKTIKYHTVGTVIKSNRKSLKEAKSIPLTHRYMIAYLPDVVQALQKTVAGIH